MFVMGDSFNLCFKLILTHHYIQTRPNVFWEIVNFHDIESVYFSSSNFCFENKTKKSHSQSSCKPVVPLKQLPPSCTPHSLPPETFSRELCKLKGGTCVQSVLVACKALSCDMDLTCLEEGDKVMMW